MALQVNRLQREVHDRDNQLKDLRGALEARP
jgi:hypothetical protein